ncbi:MAG: hypothetical protein EOM23_01855, partial [Candidatus Moranbacteria bacterium]|nr:hypothetical protein [Candidatus Moranbacteria bacterium]
AGIYANKNTVPDEPGSPVYPSGVRLGTPLVTTRGMKEKEMHQIAAWIARVSERVGQDKLPTDKEERKEFISKMKKIYETDKTLLQIFKEVKAMTKNFPLFAA